MLRRHEDHEEGVFASSLHLLEVLEYLWHDIDGCLHTEEREGIDHANEHIAI